MKTTMSADGLLTIEAENALEAYALRQWSNANYMPRAMLNRAPDEADAWRGGAMMVIGADPGDRNA